MATALLEAALSIALLAYLAIGHLAAWHDYLLGALLLLLSFALMQKTITLMVGIRYSDVPKMIKKQLKTIRN